MGPDRVTKESVPGSLASRGDRHNRAAWARHLPPGLDLETVDLLRERSLPKAWRNWWRADPESPSVIDLTGAVERTITRGELDLRTQRLALALHRLGLRRQDRVLVSARASVSLLTLYIAVLRLGAVAVPANTAYRERELQHIVRDCQPAIAILDDEERGDWARRVSERGEQLSVLHPQRAEVLERDALGNGELDGADPSDLALICYTSGTTGAPKGAMLTHGNLLAGAEALRLAWRWTENDGLVLALPLFHMHGLGVGLHGSLLAGARILLLPGFDPNAVLRASARQDATLFFGVPTMYVRLLELLARDGAAASILASLRLCVSGSAPLLPSVWNQFCELTGQRILERYGMSETVMNISNPYDGERRPGSVGLPLPGVEVRAVAGDREVAGGGVGEILVRGPNVFIGYWNQPAATRQALTDDGWLHTGDMGTRSPDGYVTIVARLKELIITGGYNVYPREVEEVLEEHPGVKEAAVVGRPSLEWGEEIVAFVVLTDGGNPPAPNELEQFCRERLAAFKRPRQISFVDTLPKNDLGKLVRARLLA